MICTIIIVYGDIKMIKFILRNIYFCSSNSVNKLICTSDFTNYIINSNLISRI